MMKILISMLLAFSIVAKEKVDASSKKAMLTVLQKNEALHAAYFNYDAKKVEKAKAEVFKAMEAVKHKGMSPLLKKSMKFLGKISASEKQDANNKSYHYASVYMIQVIDKFDLGKTYAAYYCPMVRKKWIQNIDKDAKVNNPYDSSMPHCGGRL